MTNVPKEARHCRYCAADISMIMRPASGLCPACERGLRWARENIDEIAWKADPNTLWRRTVSYHPPAPPPPRLRGAVLRYCAAEIAAGARTVGRFGLGLGAGMFGFWVAIKLLAVFARAMQ